MQSELYVADNVRITSQVRLKSLKSEVSTHITFVNKTGRDVRILWLNFEGDEVAYNIIPPEQTRRQQTFVTHPWIFRDLHTQERLVAGGRSVVCAKDHRDLCVYVERIPRLQWDPLSHCLYPQEFKELARMLLLCHRRMQSSIEGGETSALCVQFSTLPGDILLKLVEHSSPRGLPDIRVIEPCFLPVKPPEESISMYVIDRGCRPRHLFADPATAAFA